MSEKSQVQVVALSIEGMHCASCVEKIENRYKETPGIIEAAVNFATHEASVTFDPNVIAPDKIPPLIKDLGYKATLITAETDWAQQEKKQHRKEQKDLYQRFWFAALFTSIIIILSMPELFPFVQKIPLLYINYIQLLLATPIQFYAGLRFVKGLKRFLFTFRADMDTLIGIGTLTAYLYSALATLHPALLLRYDIYPYVYFDTQAAIITFILLGFFLESRARGQTGEALLKLASLQMKKAHLLRNGEEIEIDVFNIRPGDSVVIRPGERIPIDGIILNGRGGMDESMMTGESLPVEKGEGDWVFAGTINQTGYLVLSATKIGEETALAQMIHVVREAMRTKAPIARLADRISAVFVPIVLLIAFATLGVWTFLGPKNISAGIIHFIAVLIVACPCALGLATPTALIAGMGRGATRGVLFRSGAVIEKVAGLKGFLFDKTGTLTQGNPTLYQIVLPPNSPIDEEKALQIAASVEKGSEHRLALAFLNAAEEKRISLLPLASFKAHAGKGVEAVLEGDSFFVGTELFMQENSIELDPVLKVHSEQLEQKWATLVFLAVRKKAIALFAIHDPLREEALPMVEALKKRGYQLGLITGDRKSIAQKVAEGLGIASVFAEVPPQGKAEKVREWQQEVGSVAMVGDGINDAPALAAADVGISLATGTDIAREAADITLLRGSIGLIPFAIDLAQRTFRIIRQNLFMSFFYNILLIPIAAGVLEPVFHLRFSPVWASIAMAASSVTVVTNSLRLKRGRV
jgi:Cu+-exporting ATPase